MDKNLFLFSFLSGHKLLTFKMNWISLNFLNFGNTDILAWRILCYGKTSKTLWRFCNTSQFPHYDNSKSLQSVHGSSGSKGEEGSAGQSCPCMRTQHSIMLAMTCGSNFHHNGVPAQQTVLCLHLIEFKMIWSFSGLLCY